MKRVLPKILLILLALSSVAATVFFDQATRSDAFLNDEFTIEVFEKQDDDTVTLENGAVTIESGASGRVSVSVGDHAVLRFAPETSAELHLKPASDTMFPSIEVALAQGRLWINASASPLSVKTSAGEVEIFGEQGISDLQYSEGRLIVSALRQHNFVTFLDRRLVVPENAQMALSDSKIRAAEGTIAALHLSKLLKEFPYEPLAEKDAWMSVNGQDDEVFFDASRKKFSEALRERGGSGQASSVSAISVLAGIAHSLDTALTFDAKKRDEKNIDLAKDALDASLFSVLLGDTAAQKKNLAEFNRLIAELSPLAKQTPQFQNLVTSRLNQVSFARPYTPYFDAKHALRNVVLTDAVSRLDTGFRDVLGTASEGQDTETRQKTAVSLRAFASLVNREQGRIQDAAASDDLFFLSIRLNNFLAQHHDFLREEWLKLAELLESAHLRLVQTREESDDQRQYFLGEKIALIRSIELLLKTKELSFQDARKSMLLLGNAVEALKPTFSDTAIVAFFDSELAELRPLLAFLRSPEAVYVRGSFEESMEDFEKRQSEVREVQDLLAAANGGEKISPARREELANQIARDFASLNVTNVKLVFPESTDDTRVTVESAEMEGTAFRSIYDTARKLFTDIVIAEETVPQGVRLENFQRFFFLKTGRLAPEVDETIESLTEEPSGRSVVERVAISKLITELKKLNIAVEDKYFGLENFNDGVIHVRLGLIGEGSDAKVFSFDVSHKSSVVSVLKVQTVLGEIPVNDTFGLGELPVKVSQIYQRAVFEKQKEEELKKFLEEEEAASTEEGNL